MDAVQREQLEEPHVVDAPQVAVHPGYSKPDGSIYLSAREIDFVVELRSALCVEVAVLVVYEDRVVPEGRHRRLPQDLRRRRLPRPLGVESAHERNAGQNVLGLEVQGVEANVLDGECEVCEEVDGQRGSWPVVVA